MKMKKDSESKADVSIAPKSSAFTEKFLLKSSAAVASYTVAVLAAVYICVIFEKNAVWYVEDPLFKLIRTVSREPAIGITAVSVVWLVGVIIILLTMLNKSVSYINAVTHASQMLLQNDGTPISLPRPLAEVQDKLNTVKEQSYHNYQLAKEEEKKKNDLLVYLAHDLKTPLTSVIGYLTLVDDAPNLPEENKTRYTRIALEKAERLEMLLNEFFDITRFSLHGIELEKKHINLNILLYQMSEEFYPVYKERGLEIKIDITDNIVILGDPDKIARVFDNLLKNAGNYSHKDTVVEISATAESDMAVITIKNRADKIPKENLEKLFDMFYRADASRNASSGGAGVGLAVSKEIVELHGGTISVSSDDEFTRFTVKLPTADSSSTYKN